MPKDARLDIDNGTISLGITNVRNLDIGFSIQRYNKVVMSEQFKTELRNDKIAGVGMTIAGLAIMYGGAYLASVAPETAIGGQAFAGYTGFQMGGTLFCLGLGRAVGANKNSIAQDIISAGSPPDLDAYTTIGNFRKP